jgi:peroxiredoxin
LDGGWVIGQVSGLSNFYRVGKESWRYAHIVKEKQVVALLKYINNALAESPIEVGVVGLLKEPIA